MCYDILQTVCQTALTVKCTYYTQKAACNAFIKLIELCEDYDIQLAETAEKFINSFNIYDIKGKNIEFEIMYSI